MEELICKIIETFGDEQYVQLFISKIWQLLYKGENCFYWAMDDELEAKRLFGHHQIGWFNNKTQEYKEEHSDALNILLERISWSSKNSRKVDFNYKPAMNAHQLFCVEMKLKSEYQFLGNNFYLKIGMIPIWNEDYSKIVGYYDKPVIDFHD